MQEARETPLPAADREVSEKAGKEEFGRLYQEHLSRIYRYVYTWVRSREEAEDLTSEIFLKALQGVDYERGPKAIENWLYQVARTTIADYWRGRYRHSTFSFERFLEVEDREPADEERTLYYSRRTKNKDLLYERLSTSPLERFPDEEEGAIGHNWLTDKVARLLEALPEQYSNVLLCRFLLDLSIKETAHLMGVTEANAKVLQFRALKRAAEVADVLTY